MHKVALGAVVVAFGALSASTDLKVNRNPRRQSGRAVSNSGGSQGICENEVAPQVACCHLQSLQAGTYPLIKATIP
jgi:hypothetical protein